MPGTPGGLLIAVEPGERSIGGAIILKVTGQIGPRIGSSGIRSGEDRRFYRENAIDFPLSPGQLYNEEPFGWTRWFVLIDESCFERREFSGIFAGEQGKV